MLDDGVCAHTVRVQVSWQPMWKLFLTTAMVSYVVHWILEGFFSTLTIDNFTTLQVDLLLWMTVKLSSVEQLG